MKKTVPGDGPVIIKKYANRRLYNTETSSYITLEHLAAMTRDGRDFKVVDAKSEEDITHNILTQIIMEEEQRGQTMLPVPFLRQLIAKYEAFAALEPDSDAARTFIALEDWANGGAPLPFATGAQIFEDLIAADTPGTGAWRIDGVTLAPSALSCPAIEFVSLNDRIVPAASAANLPNRRDLGAGHVGMIVGRGARAQLWEPLSDWLKALSPPR